MNNLSGNEFLNYIWLNNLVKDPVIARLVEMLDTYVLYTSTFGDNFEKAKEAFDEIRSDCEDLRLEVVELHDEVTRLSGRTLLDLCNEIENDNRHLQQKLRTSEREAKEQQARADNAITKLRMWNIIANE